MATRKRKYLRFETHAVKRMQKRGISQEQVEDVVKNPDKAGSAKRKGSRRLEKQMSRRRRLAVILEETDEFYRIVTAWWV